jgi:cytoskeletal protein CcmA (bactofilin family)
MSKPISNAALTIGRVISASHLMSGTKATDSLQCNNWSGEQSLQGLGYFGSPGKACRAVRALRIVVAVSGFPALLSKTSIPEQTGTDPVVPGARPMSTPASGLAQIGKSVVIKGELSGSEDLYLDGQVEGSIALKGNSLTVGPNGQVKASIDAKGVVVQGRLEGNIQASDRVDLRKSATVTGDITAQRISIEEGAFLKGKVDVHRSDGK